MHTGTTDTIHWAARRVPVPGLGDLFSEACGPADGPPVLLVMGAMNPAHFWAPGFVAALVQAGCRVVRYDHRDTGRSFVHPLHAPPYALDTLVADALRVQGAWVWRGRRWWAGPWGATSRSTWRTNTRSA